MKDKTFILNIGVQKSGTSWLYKLIDKSDETNMGKYKEYHVFDANYVNELKYFRVRIIDLIRRRGEFLKYRMQRNETIYFKYFEEILKNKKVTGDFTPSYSALNKETLIYIRDEFEKIGIKVKVIICLREPLDRAISAYYMNKKRGNKTELGDKSFMEYAKSKQCKIRTEYEVIVPRAKEVFNKEDILILDFKSMFEGNTIKRLEKFLNIELDKEYGRNFINRNLDKNNERSLREEVEAEFRLEYNKTYEYIKKQSLIE